MAATPEGTVVAALRIRIAGVVQGVGFRPFVFRLARRFGIVGWVRNAQDGVTIHAEGMPGALDDFGRALRAEPPPAAVIASFSVAEAAVTNAPTFEIHESADAGAPSVRISPDLPACADCLRELADPANRRYAYAYINCTNCGPRYSIVYSLPYDRPRTTMAGWPLCAACDREYHDPADRRFHAQPVACERCGPAYVYLDEAALASDVPVYAPGGVRGNDAVVAGARDLRAGKIVAIKGIGGYHLACDARNATAVAALRERKYRKERPFALMACDIGVAASLGTLDAAARELLESPARPIVLVPMRERLAGIAPDNDDVGVMLPYAPLHALLFANGAPDVLVLTSANRSSEPIAYDDGDALESLAGIADTFLLGERTIARRIDDSIARTTPYGPMLLRRSRGYSPGAAATLPVTAPILAVGGDLKSAIALAVDGAAFTSQHIGDLEQLGAYVAFRSTVADLCAMYEIDPAELTIAYDAHPQYRSSQLALDLDARNHVAVQHHRAHVASVLAERGALETTVTGVAFDGTGYGDDGKIWGGEFFSGSVSGGLDRALHLRAVPLPGGDAAARSPVQSAAGFLWELDPPGLAAGPFDFPKRYEIARELLRKDVRVFRTTSAGRLFDAAAAICGFTRDVSFEGQAAMWLEHVARSARSAPSYAFDVRDGELDDRPVLAAMIGDRIRGLDVREIARGFHHAVADAIVRACDEIGNERIAASGGVFQNALLVDLLAERLGGRLWLNAAVPANDGGLCLGQAAIASVTTIG